MFNNSKVSLKYKLPHFLGSYWVFGVSTPSTQYFHQNFCGVTHKERSLFSEHHKFMFDFVNFLKKILTKNLHYVLFMY